MAAGGAADPDPDPDGTIHTWLAGCPPTSLGPLCPPTFTAPLPPPLERRPRQHPDATIRSESVTVRLD
jgi:hypothetical protein